MHNHTSTGIVIGSIFGAVITWIAMSEAALVGGPALIASAVFGLAAGVCIAGLIAANFWLLDMEEREEAEANAHLHKEAHAHA